MQHAIIKVKGSTNVSQLVSYCDQQEISFCITFKFLKLEKSFRGNLDLKISYKNKTVISSNKMVTSRVI